MSNTSNLGISSLKFYTGNGNEIQMLKQYSVCWEILPANEVVSSFLKNPKGHFEFNSNNEIDVIVDDPGIIDSSTIIKKSKIAERNAFYEHTSESYNSSTNMYSSINYVDYDFDVNDYKVLSSPAEILFYSYRYSSLDDNKKRSQFSGKLSVNATEVVVTENHRYTYQIEDVNPGERYKIFSYADTQVIWLGKDNSYISKIDLSEPVINITVPSNAYKMYACFYNDVQKDDYNLQYLKKYNDNYDCNTIRLTVTDGSQTVSDEYNLVDLLQSNCGKSDDLLTYFTQYTQYDENIDFLNEDIPSKQKYNYGVKSNIFALTKLSAASFLFEDEPDTQNISTACYIMKYNIGEEQFPYMKYIGNVQQDKVSTNFIASTTIIIANYNEVTKSLSNPKIQNGDYVLHFRFQKDAEMGFIMSDDNVNLTKATSIFINPESDKECVSFTVGFESDTEGCYQNIMGMFIRNRQTNYDYFIGSIIFSTEVEGEDERYRALFTNFGIPDPIKYPNIFKEQEIGEEGTNWIKINEKSKELFLTYDSIFPYVGTYKALFNAIKFLGYQDIVFKEWYRIKDTDNNTKFVAIQNYDTASQKNIQSVLKSYGVEYGEYERYTKLNRLSMIYHTQEISDNPEEKMTAYNSDGSVNSTSSYNSNDIQAIHNVYEYRNDEILAKLYSVKNWLERFISGVNCYISDINAEGVVLERLKTVAYATVHEYKDIYNEGYFTPNTTHTKTSFVDSSAIITCSLNEFESLTFKDYMDYPVERFIKREYTKQCTIDGSIVDVSVYDSAPLSALTVADEYEFVLNLNTSSGSLYEFTDSNTIDNPVILNDGEIDFLSTTGTVSKIDRNELPIINIKKGNLRNVYDEWNNDLTSPDSNLEYTISKTYANINSSTYTGNTYYKLKKRKGIGSNEVCMVSKGSIQLVPDMNSSTVQPEFYYTSNNKWNVPMFFIKGYKVINNISGYENIFNNTSPFILEMIEGDIKFRNRQQTEGVCIGANMHFSESTTEDTNVEQNIDLTYTYKSERVPIYEYDNSGVNSSTSQSFSQLIDSITENVHTNKYVDVKVNRLGDYSVLVNAYDAYNNIFTSKDDDSCSITCSEPEIDVIINQENSENEYDFYKSNIDASALTSDEHEEVLNKMSENVLFPKNYKIYEATPNSSTKTISYDNISYALDTPKANDYVLLSNLTERVLHIEENSNHYNIGMKYGNPELQQVVNTSTYVNLCVFDENLHEVIFQTTTPYVITDSSLAESMSDKLEFVSRNIEIEKISGTTYPTDETINSSIISTVNVNNNINMYLINASQLNLNDSILVNNEDDRTCFISINEEYQKDLFNLNQMVKIVATVSNSLGDIVLGETAYKIIKKCAQEIEGTAYNGYVINGMVNLDFVNDTRNRNIYNRVGEKTLKLEDIDFCLMPVQTQAVEYVMRVNSDAVENTIQYDNDFYYMQTDIPYNSKQLMFDSYYDSTYSIETMKFDVTLLKNIWLDNPNVFIDASLYKFTEHPVTIEQDRNVLVKPSDNNKQLCSGYKTRWKWKVYTTEENSNWVERSNSLEKTLLFESHNDMLSVKPYMVGPQFIEMTCIDKFGNVISNTHGGNIFVK